MSWEVILVPEVHDWYLALDEISASLVRDSVELLAEHGPALGRPAADRITGSSLHNVKELRPGSAGGPRSGSCSSSIRSAGPSCWWQATRPGTGLAGTATP